MSTSPSASAVDSLLNINEISARTGHSTKSIRQLRSIGHELYRLAHKDGNRLVLEANVVDDWVEHHRAGVTRRLQARQRREYRALAEPLERLVSDEERRSVDTGYDFIRHHSWCMNAACHGCRGERW